MGLAVCDSREATAIATREIPVIALRTPPIRRPRTETNPTCVTIPQHIRRLTPQTPSRGQPTILTPFNPTPSILKHIRCGAARTNSIIVVTARQLDLADIVGQVQLVLAGLTGRCGTILGAALDVFLAGLVEDVVAGSAADAVAVGVVVAGRDTQSAGTGTTAEDVVGIARQAFPGFRHRAERQPTNPIPQHIRRITNPTPLLPSILSTPINPTPPTILHHKRLHTPHTHPILISLTSRLTNPTPIILPKVVPFRALPTNLLNRVNAVLEGFDALAVLDVVACLADCAFAVVGLQAVGDHAEAVGEFEGGLAVEAGQAGGVVV